MNGSADMLNSAFKILLSLTVVLAVLFCSFYGLKRFIQRGGCAPKHKMISILASQYIGIKKSISIVKVPGAVLILGITNDRIHLLTQITDQQSIETILAADQAPGGSIFSDQLSKLTNMLSAKSDHSV